MRVARKLLVAAILLALTFAVAPLARADNGQGDPGQILAANVRVAGWSLTRAARETAYFNTSITDWDLGYRDESRLPGGLPFQMLYMRPGTSFEVKPGTTLYLPISYIDSSPPVLGTYPSNNAEAQDYFYDLDQLGVRNAKVTIDDQEFVIGREYVAGPIDSKLGYDFLEDPDQYFHYTCLGVFLKLAKGEHSVAVQYELAGELSLDYFASLGLPREPVPFSFGYSVTVK